MKFWEAMKALEEGKKVRCLKWIKNEFIFKDPKHGFISDNDDIWKGPSGYWICEEWELYEEPVKTYTFTEAIQLMKQGKCIKRKDWIGFIREQGDSHLYWNRLGVGRFSPTIEEIEATDWIIVEDKK
jgi:hypothetical protein